MFWLISTCLALQYLTSTAKHLTVPQNALNKMLCNTSLSKVYSLIGLEGLTEKVLSWLTHCIVFVIPVAHVSSPPSVYMCLCVCLTCLPDCVHLSPVLSFALTCYYLAHQLGATLGHQYLSYSSVIIHVPLCCCTFSCLSASCSFQALLSAHATASQQPSAAACSHLKATADLACLKHHSHVHLWSSIRCHFTYTDCI